MPSPRKGTKTGSSRGASPSTDPTSSIKTAPPHYSRDFPHAPRQRGRVKPPTPSGSFQDMTCRRLASAGRAL
eukprot:3076277-Pyramimonas_sp.AAC.1